MATGTDRALDPRMELGVADLGRRGYEEMIGVQERLVEQLRAGDTGDLLLLLEHPPTFTLGRRTEAGDLLHPAAWYRERGMTVTETPRGGKVTYHGPGQLVAYPIIDLRRIGPQPDGSGRVGVAWFVDTLETAMARALRRWRIVAGGIEGLTGLWVSRNGPLPDGATAASTAAGVAGGSIRKIGSIGLQISRGISSHGISINVTDDLTPFEWINSCGIEHCAATSVEAELLRDRGDEQTPFIPRSDGIGRALAEELAEILHRDLESVRPAELGLAPAADRTDLPAVSPTAYP